MKPCPDLFGKGLLSAAILLAQLTAFSLEVRLQTRHGGALSGEILRFEDNAVTIGIGTAPPRKEVSVPLDSIQGVDLPTADLMRNPSRVLHLAPLFPYASEALRQGLLEGARHLAGNGLWMECHTWLEALEGVGFTAPERLLLGLTRARALHALGLHTALKTELTRLNGAISPIDAPLALCILNAEARLRDTELEKALYWAQLPALRLPTHVDPYLQDLAECLERQLGAPVCSSRSSLR